MTKGNLNYTFKSSYNQELYGNVLVFFQEDHFGYFISLITLPNNIKSEIEDGGIFYLRSLDLIDILNDI